jgi:hypothetical protein
VARDGFFSFEGRRYHVPDAKPGEPRSSQLCPTQRCIAGHLSAIRRRSMGELISERIRRNARELKLYVLAETADELVDRAEAGKLGYREFLDLVLESEVRRARRPPLRVQVEALGAAASQDTG